jgi:hypothetical protein
MSAPNPVKRPGGAVKGTRSKKFHTLNNDGANAYDVPSETAEGMIKFQIDDCPWWHVLVQVPLSRRVFISGSAATWIAERSLLNSTPEWTPHDIDIFACLPSVEFENMVSMYVHRHTTSCDISIERRQIRHDVVDITIANCRYIKSFIRCPPHCSASDVVQQFDIDICTPYIVHENGTFWVEMSATVADGIRNRCMNCVVRKQHSEFLCYPFKKTLHRLRKYVTRGYVFASLGFVTATHIDFPDLDHECTLNVDDFDIECMMTKRNQATGNASVGDALCDVAAN